MARYHKHYVQANNGQIKYAFNDSLFSKKLDLHLVINNLLKFPASCDYKLTVKADRDLQISMGHNFVQLNFKF